MEKVNLVLEDEKQVRVTLDSVTRRLEDMVDVLREDQCFEVAEEVSNLYRVYNKLVSIEGVNLDPTGIIPVFLYDGFDVAVCTEAKDGLIFTGVETEEIRIYVKDVSRYQVVEGDVIVCGANNDDPNDPCLIIVGESDWDSLMEIVEENKVRETIYRVIITLPIEEGELDEVDIEGMIIRSLDKAGYAVRDVAVDIEEE